jgi:transcriptional regulator with XRE-family HTH domain
MALNLGARFREIRGERSVEQFAQLLETTPQTISGIEEQSQLPSPELLKKLIDIHPNKDLIWLWGGESPKLDSPLTGIETILLMNYRASSKEAQASIRRMAAFHATYQNED